MDLTLNYHFYKIYQLEVLWWLITEASRLSKNLGHWQMLATFLQAGLGFLIGVVQCALIFVGLRRMGQAFDERKGQHEETVQAMRTQHEETMRALEFSTKPCGNSSPGPLSDHEYTS